MSSVSRVQSSVPLLQHSRSQSSYTQQLENKRSQQLVHGQSDQSWFPSGLLTPPATKEMTGISLGNHGSYPTTRHYGSDYAHGNIPSYHARGSSDSFTNSKSAAVSGIKQESVNMDFSSSNAIASHLQIPDSVNKSKGSLAEFAAEITCLFWFEDSATLQYAKDLAIDTHPNKGLVPDATPSIGFRKWVTTILSTTQVGKNVILLALMFIYRLKKFNPSVSGKRGSEFRLLTIALMLGNKFLDDNTYTNKTWAEVSGISVTEIHIMEVEFLSNMRYELYASKEEWANWKTLLGKFGAFYEKASRIELPDAKSIPPITPVTQTFNYKLPSPPSIHHHYTSTDYSNLPNPMSTLPQLPRSPVRHYPQHEPLSDRKRSFDSSADSLPPAKRTQFLPPTSAHHSPALMHPLSNQISSARTGNVAPGSADIVSGSRMPQLPIPRIATTIGMNSSIAPLSLPQTRAMTSVYAPTTTAWNQPMTPTSAVQPAMNGQYHQNNISPIEGLRALEEKSSAHTSPTNLYGPSTPTRPGLSPSYFLTNRSSPYRPVRHVNTLLIPPSSAAMQNHARDIDYQQIHYQPLGRPATERRVGPVPYLFPDGRQQSNVSTPTQSNYRPY